MLNKCYLFVTVLSFFRVFLKFFSTLLLQGNQAKRTA